jgi:mannose-6-phosphate isomerase-like protein (cupin superfamily)
MKQVPIKNLKPGLVKGVEVYLPSEQAEVYKETYFSWFASPLVAKMNSSNISGGLLKTWHHTPTFTEVETHIEPEMFYFISGTALMLFIDLVEGIPDMDTVQIVRVQSGTQLIISAGKAHFVPVAESNEPVSIIVVSPKVDAPRTSLSTPVEAL